MVTLTIKDIVGPPEALVEPAALGAPGSAKGQELSAVAKLQSVSDAMATQGYASAKGYGLLVQGLKLVIEDDKEGAFEVFDLVEVVAERKSRREAILLLIAALMLVGGALAYLRLHGAKPQVDRQA